MPGRLTTAAGVVALDPQEGKHPKVLLVHRPAYDDWSLPKGKVLVDEPLTACAVRETEEETGVRVRLGLPLGTIAYTVSGGPKEVYYWRADVTRTQRRAPDSEVDKIAWVSAHTALTRMTYADERALVDAALAKPATTPFLVVRHGKAMDRKHWTGRDQGRPVNSRGRKQSASIVPVLAAYGVQRLDSSSSLRCMQTLKPYAKASGLEVHGWSTLSEELAKGNDASVAKLMRRLTRTAVAENQPAAVCGHRPVLPVMLDAVGLEPRPMQTGAVAIAHLDAAGAVIATEFHKPLC